MSAPPIGITRQIPSTRHSTIRPAISRSEFSGSTAAKYAAPASSVSRHSLTIHLNSLTLVASPILPFSLRSEEHTSELQSREKLVCRLLLEKKKEAVARPGLGPCMRL